MRKSLLFFLALVFCSRLWGGESIEMYSILTTKDGTPIVSIVGVVRDLSSMPIEEVLKQELPDPSLGALKVFVEYQLALKKGDLVTALGLVNAGPSMENVKRKFDASTKEEIEQRKGLDIRVVGMGVTGNHAVVWYEMRGAALPGGKFPWLDQLSKGPSGWKMAFDLPVNGLGIQMLSVVFDAKVGAKKAVRIDRLNHELFALGEGEKMQIIRKDSTVDQPNFPDLVLAINHSLIKQKNQSIGRIEAFGLAERESQVVKEAYLRIQSGKSIGDVLTTINGQKTSEDPYLWKNGESGYGYCWAIATVMEGAYFVIGTADNAMTAFFVGADLKIGSGARGSKGALSRLLTNPNVIPLALNLGRRAVD